jgi:hypothetical protein
LLAGLIVLAGWWWIPRARLAWRLHDASTQAADYGLCMAGPTGAVLLRDEPSKFWQLVRRRIVASAGEECPLVACSELARELTGSDQVARLHRSAARDYADWGAVAGKLELRQLAAALPHLSEMAQGSWPFVRGGAALLMKPSLGAKEAIHPIGTTRPGNVGGLTLGNSIYKARRVTERGWYVVTSNGQDAKAYRSRDRGHSWSQTSPWQTALQGTANRCAHESGEFAFAVEAMPAEGSLAVKYFKQELKTGQSKIPRPMRALRAFTCDETAALLLLGAPSSHWELWLCVATQACRVLPTPAQLEGLALQGVDIARQKGANIVAVTQGALVRVLSSRDEGRSYTPFTVAVDTSELEFPVRPVSHPAQLLAIANTLFLIQEPVSGSGPSLALSSVDQGASWHTWGPVAESQ